MPDQCGAATRGRWRVVMRRRTEEHATDIFEVSNGEKGGTDGSCRWGAMPALRGIATRGR